MNHSGNRPAGPDPLTFLAGGGEMGDRTRRFDWSNTPVGPVAGWPQSLKIAVRIMLSSRYAMWLGWGPQFTFFYNDAYAAMTLGPKHPWALGRSAREVWAEIWPEVGPRADRVIATGEATWDEGLLLFLERQGFPEESYHTFSYSPVPGDTGGVGGMLCVVTEDTRRVIGERRLRTLRELAARTTAEARSAEDACQTAALTLADNRRDLPFALIYLLDGGTARLAGATGLPAGSPAAPSAVHVDEAAWPFAAVLASGRAEVVADLGGRFGPLACGPWPEPVERAVVVPVARPGQARPAGFVVAGASPRLVFDDEYEGFLELLAGHVATAVSNARAYEEERRRAEQLAELDRAKTAFFSNVSHEFRTPLTLMLGPVEDILARPAEQMRPEDRSLLEVVSRNGLRLLRLVNTLLDFSRIEAGRVQARYEPTDLAAFTADLASNFRSACERAGLRLVVDCPPLGEPAFVDRQMWEKVVLNLLSNAFKFTFSGEIAVSLRRADDGAELRVRDTGIGVPADEMPRLFERFHRVENARGRTHEGSGIGLALVQELVKLHGGTVTAASVVGQGTTFTVAVPLGSAHLPADRIGAGRTLAAAGMAVSPFVEEALRWLPTSGARGQESRVSPDADAWGSRTPDSGPRTADSLPRVLVADDNADMRQYVARLLADQFQVEAVADGAAAAAAARERPPELILSDVMMPRLDGFGLLRAVRADPRTRDVPVILLSARAGEESRVEGVEAGADDYLVKPFSARELLARVTAQVQMARLRRESERAVRESGERLRMALTAARMVAWVMDPATGRVTVSDNAPDVFGLPPGLTLDHTDKGMALVHPDDADRHRAVITKAVAECGSYVSQFRLTRPNDGAVVWMEERGHGVCDGPGGAVRLVGVVMNVTARVRAEEEVRDARRRVEAERGRLADVFRQAPAFLCGLRGPDHVFELANDRYYELVGHRDLIGRPLREALPEVEGQGFIELLDRVYRTGEPFVGTGIRVLLARQPHQPTEERYVDFVYQALRDPGGAVAGIVAVGVDVTDRQRAEGRLRASEEKYRTLFDTMDQGFCVVEVVFDGGGRATDYRVVEMNPAFEQHTGMHGLVGRLVREAVPGLEEFWFETYGRVARTGEPARFEHEAGPMGGRWFDVYAFRHGGEGSSRVAILFTDITERKRLEAQRHQFVSMAEKSQEFIGMAGLDQTPFFVNEAGRRMVGLDADRVSRVKVIDFFFPEDHERVLTEIVPAVMRDGHADVEIRFRNFTTGDAVWVIWSVFKLFDNAGIHTGIATVSRNITERKRADDALRQAEARFRTMADTAPVLIWQTDDAGVTFVNRHYLDFFGRPFDAVAGMGWAAFLHPDDASGYTAAYLSAFTQRKGYEYQCRFRRRDGEYRWFQNVGTPHHAPDGTFVGFVGCSVDVTDIKRAEEALVESDRRKDEFLATLAHELRNPLAPLRNGLQVMKLAGGDGQAVERSRAVMERQVEQMARLIDDLMDLSRISRGKIVLQKTRLPIATPVRTAVDTSRPLVDQQGHRLVVDVPDEPVYVDGDNTRLTQVFANLLNNAAKYTDRGGRIRLSVERQGGEVVVAVADTGVGIPAPMLPRVFDMFAQVDRSLEKAQGGLGIGLNIVQKLVEMHGGSIAAESGGHGLGSTFTVRLPVVQAVTADRPDDGGEGDRRPAARRRVLVVDDNADGATSLAEMLELMGNETRTARDGLEAVAAAAAFRPDVILMDIGMPKLNGYDACRRIREQPSDRTPVIVACTGWGQEDDKKKSQDAGFDLHMVKPVDPAALEKLLAGLRAATG